MLKLAEIDFVENCETEEVSVDEAKEYIENVVPEMIKILEEKEGLGLAAPQIGIAKKFFVARDMETGEFNTYFNAKYFKDNKTRVQMEESCLSYPDYKPTTVKRFKRIKMIYQVLEDENLVEKQAKFSSPQGVVFQHEIDHCGNSTSKPKTIYMK